MSKAFEGRLAFLSNFYDAPVGEYPTAEHAFQAAKTNDPDWKQRIKNAKTPGQAKRLGKRCPMRPDWDAVRVEAMKMVIEQKFEDPELHQMLLDTGDEELVEENYWHDTFWGVCSCYIHKWEGQNMLGRILMSYRNYEQGKIDYNRMEG